MTTRWGITDRVWYCEVHDSLIRARYAETDHFQCDAARADQIPMAVEPCSSRSSNYW